MKATELFLSWISVDFSFQDASSSLNTTLRKNTEYCNIDAVTYLRWDDVLNTDAHVHQPLFSLGEKKRT